MHISSSYAKILRQKLFHTQFPGSGSKAKDGEKRKKQRLNNGNNNGQATHGARKPPGPKRAINIIGHAVHVVVWFVCHVDHVMAWYPQHNSSRGHIKFCLLKTT